MMMSFECELGFSLGVSSGLGDVGFHFDLDVSSYSQFNPGFG